MIPHASVDILDTPGYVLKKKDSPKKLELCFMGDMRETLVDVSEAFSKHFDEEKLPVLHITKFDMIGETEGTTQVKDNYLFHIVKCKSIILHITQKPNVPNKYFCDLFCFEIMIRTEMYLDTCHPTGLKD